MKNNFKIGEIVTLKSHPLFDNNFKKIAELPMHVPPLMIIKEVLFEKENKKIYSSEIENAKISDCIKYNCVYFNTNKSEFVEKIIYESFLRSYTDLQYFRTKDDDEINTPLKEQLIPEVLTYTKFIDYNFGEVIQFKTKKLEHRKAYALGSDKKQSVSFQSPNFIISGIKREVQEDLFYNDGQKKKISESKLIKVSWFNHFQNKISEKYLPFSLFVKDLKIN